MSTEPRPSWATTLTQEDFELAVQRKLFTVEAAGYYMGTSKRWIYDRIKDSTLACKKVGKRFLIPQSSIDAILGP